MGMIDEKGEGLMVKWDYIVVNIDHHGICRLMGSGFIHSLDDLGARGFELVSITWPSNLTPQEFPGIAIFKRRLRQGK